jgi:hypothetical protein
MNMNIDEIKLENGSAHYADGRTVASETGLAPETEVEYIGRQSRWTGTGYYNSIYRICGTDDALVIRHNDGPMSNVSWDNVSLKKEYFAEQRSYGTACREASQKYHLPMEVCLAVGPEFCEEFAAEAAKVTYREGGFIGSNTTGFAKVEPYKLDDGAVNELRAGIGRRKGAIIALLAGCSEELKAKIDRMGQKNSTRIAQFFTAMAENN